VSKNNRPTERAVDFKSATLDTVRLVLQDADTATMLEQLTQRLEDSQGFFAEEPVVIDARALEAAPDWQAITSCLREHELHPIAVAAEAPTIAQSAQAAGLAVVSLSTGPQSSEGATAPVAAAETAPTSNPTAPEALEAQPTTPADRTADTPSPAPTAPAPAADADVTAPSDNGAQRPTMVIERQLRSGQRIYAQKSDLIVIGVVGQGAEIIADGNIHVYGPLRGRAMAGAQGNTKARIFTTELDPELIAIAGVYKVVEEPLPKNQHRKSAVICLEHEHLKIESIG